MQFNLCNEPWLKYSMLLVADQGLKPSQWTSARLLREVLFLETARHVRLLCCGLLLLTVSRRELVWAALGTWVL